MRHYDVGDWIRYSKIDVEVKVKHDGRVVKALDLSSNGQMSAWVRTPLVLLVFLKNISILHP